MDLDLKIKGIQATPRGQHQFRQNARCHRNETRVEKRPAEVPPLNLGKLGDWEEEDFLRPHSGKSQRCTQKSTAVPKHQATKIRCFCGPIHNSVSPKFPPSNLRWCGYLEEIRELSNNPPPYAEEKIIPEDLPLPSERHRQQYQQYQDELREGFRLHSQRAQPPSHHPTQPLASAEDEMVAVQQCYTSKPYTALHCQRKVEAEDLADLRRKQAVMEQVMADQLSRAVISDPDQNQAWSEQRSPAEPGSVPLRFRRRTLHETQVRTRSALTENLLSNKLRFDARILSSNGRDANRELIGFFFAYDKTLTVYEYRQFGRNRTNALPFIAKGSYKHERGRRKGTQYSLHDFYVGATLSFSSHSKSLPESMKQKPVMLLRITDLDQLVKDMLLASADDVNQGELKEEHEDRSILAAVQGTVRDCVRKRAVRVLTGLGKLLRAADVSGNGILGKEAIRRALEDFHITLPEKDFDAAWSVLDEDGDGHVDYGEFMRGMIGEMNEFRKSFVRKAYMKLDPNKSGSVSMTGIEKFYCAKGHPKVISGASTEAELTSRFIQSLQEACRDPREVSYIEFEDYYEGLSIGIPNDQDFANVLKNSWGI